MQNMHNSLHFEEVLSIFLPLFTHYSQVAWPQHLAPTGGKLFIAFIDGSYHILLISGGWELLTRLAFFWRSFFKMAADKSQLQHVSSDRWCRIMIYAYISLVTHSSKYFEASQFNIWYTNE